VTVRPKGLAVRKRFGPATSLSRRPGSERCSAYDKVTPSNPPIAERNRLSVMSWRIKRDRGAPRASRVAISFVRAVPRASSNPEMFAQANSKIRPTADIRRKRGGTQIDVTRPCLVLHR
jgi:hypothetical protein